MIFNNQQPLMTSFIARIRSYEVENPHLCYVSGQGVITSCGVEDHIPRGSPAVFPIKEGSGNK